MKMNRNICPDCSLPKDPLGRLAHHCISPKTRQELAQLHSAWAETAARLDRHRAAKRAVPRRGPAAQRHAEIRNLPDTREIVIYLRPVESTVLLPPAILERRPLEPLPRPGMELSQVRLWELQRGLCWICRDPMDPSLPENHPKGPSRDHLTPASRGGKGLSANMLWAHKRCNEERGNRTSLTRDEALRHLRRVPSLSGPVKGPDSITSCALTGLGPSIHEIAAPRAVATDDPDRCASTPGEAGQGCEKPSSVSRV